MSYNSTLDLSLLKEIKGYIAYPVYISSRVISELIQFCNSTHPNEALGFLLGSRLVHPQSNDVEYTRVVDWVTGSVESTHISANFTAEGLQQANLFLDDKYGKDREKHNHLPKIIGIVHSHPFGHEPHFSTTDLDTFLNFPYDAIGNVFILIDPVPEKPFFKVFKIIRNGSGEKILQRVPWIEYSPIKSDFQLIEQSNSENSENKNNVQQSDLSKVDTDDPYVPPKIEDLDKNKSKNKTNEKNIKDFFK